MATIFRKTVTRYLVDGKRISKAEAKRLEAQGVPVQRVTEKTRKWYIRYRVPGSSKPKTVPGYTDKAATQAKAVKLERNAVREAAGLVNPVDQYLADPVDRYVEAFQDYLLERNRDSMYRTNTVSRIRRVLELGRIGRLADLQADRVRAALRAVRETGVATATVNHYLTAIKTFSRWLWKQGRLASDPLVGLSRQNADVDRRHLRRVLSPAEFARLVEAAENSPRVFRGLAGPDRAALYMLAAGSGLRASELASVTRATLLLEADPPRVQVQAAYAKNKRDDTVPLPVEVADYLRQWLASRGTVPLDRQTRLWPGTWYKRAADMLRADLAEAGISYELDGQVFDFHALRAQYATLLGQQGVNLQTAQALLRHSDPKLTARTYTKLGITDLAGTVQGLRLRGADKDRRAVQG